MSTMAPFSAASGAPSAGAGPKALTSTLTPALAGGAGSAIRTPNIVSSPTSALARRFAILTRTSSLATTALCCFQTSGSSGGSATKCITQDLPGRTGTQVGLRIVTAMAVVDDDVFDARV